MSDLYASAVALDWDDEESDRRYANHFTTSDWQFLVTDLRRALGPIDMAWEVFDPYGLAEKDPVQGSVADAMADVYGSASHALAIARTGSASDAANELITQLEIALGHHALDVMRALDAHRFHGGGVVKIVIEQAVAAPAAAVYDAFLSASELAKWWWPHIADTVYQVDPREGGTYRIQSKAAGIGVRGDIRALDQPRTIGSTWIWLDDGVESPVEEVWIAFTDEGDRTLVRVEHELAPESGDGSDLRQGWTDVLGRLAGRFE